LFEGERFNLRSSFWGQFTDAAFQEAEDERSGFGFVRKAIASSVEMMTIMIAFI
jgi:hypothetical protein